MITILAQARNSNQENVFEVITGVFSRIDLLTDPSTLVRHLQSMSVVWAVIFIVAGITCLINGYKFYKSVTIIMAAAIGAFAGYYLGKKIQAEFIVAACLSMLLAIGCFPLMKYAVAVMGGLVGAFLGGNAWSSIGALMGMSKAADTHWVGALLGLLTCGMLAFILFKFSVVMFTSISGSTVAVLGALALLLQLPMFRDPTFSTLSRAHVAVVPLLVLVPAMIGLILQEAYPPPVTKTKGAH